MRGRNYLFGRVNMFGDLTTTKDKHDLLTEALTSRAEVSSKAYVWGFFEEEQLDADNDFFSGYLVKVMPETDEEIADRKRHKLQVKSIENRIKAKARFLLHAPSGVIAYHRAGGDITPDMFRRYFAAIMEEAFQGFFIVVHVDLIRDDREFLERVREFQRVTEIKVELHPTNPGFRREYQRYDERLKKLNAETYREQFRSPRDDGLNIDGDEEIQGKLTMASDGYGLGEITGQMEGEQRTITTGENPLYVRAPSDAGPDTLLTVLFDTFQNIWDRVRRG